jgi:hypothetical protein
MFNPEKLKVGDLFYSVKERNTSFHRKKIHREIDGEDWFKYDMPLITYELVTYKVLGILRKELEGRWKHDPHEYDLQTEFFVSYQDTTHAGTHEMDFYYDRDKFFVDIDEAMVYLKLKELEAKELDKT